MPYISVVRGETHIYEEIQGNISPRCDCSKKVKKSNLEEISEEELEKYIRDDKVCPDCLRYKNEISI